MLNAIESTSHPRQLEMRMAVYKSWQDRRLSKIFHLGIGKIILNVAPTADGDYFRAIDH